MSYYKTCAFCGAVLDPCEICDCRKEKKAKENERQEHDEANFKRNDYILENG